MPVTSLYGGGRIGRRARAPEPEPEVVIKEENNGDEKQEAPEESLAAVAATSGDGGDVDMSGLLSGNEDGKQEDKEVPKNDGGDIDPSESSAPPTKKRKKASASGASSETAVECGDAASRPRKSSKARKTEAAVQQFINDILPSLRKEMSQNKKMKSSVNLGDFAMYFHPSSKVRPAYLFPLFHFLNRTEIICTRYGNFNGSHKVKSADGCAHALLLSQSVDLTEEENQYIMRRFGRDWHKIPAKDGNIAMNAHRTGHMGQFKITLVGSYEDQFLDSQTGETIYTLNPVLSYEAIKAPAAKSGGEEK